MQCSPAPRLLPAPLFRWRYTYDERRRIMPKPLCTRALVVLSLLVPVAQTHDTFAEGAPSRTHKMFDEGARPAEGSVRANGVDFALGGTNEPSIAVNPLNSQNIAYASLFTRSEEHTSELQSRF